MNATLCLEGYHYFQCTCINTNVLNMKTKWKFIADILKLAD